MGGCPRAFTSCLLYSEHPGRLQTRAPHQRCSLECQTAALLLGRALACRDFNSLGRLWCEGWRVTLDPKTLLEKEGTVFPKPTRHQNWGCIWGSYSIPPAKSYTPFSFLFFPPFHSTSLAVAVFVLQTSPPHLCLFLPPRWRLYRHLIAIQTPVTFGCQRGCCHTDY